MLRHGYKCKEMASKNTRKTSLVLVECHLFALKMRNFRAEIVYKNLPWLYVRYTYI